MTYEEFIKELKMMKSSNEEQSTEKDLLNFLKGLTEKLTELKTVLEEDEQPELKLEVGKIYQDGNGMDVLILQKDGDDDTYCGCRYKKEDGDMGFYWYHSDGSSISSSIHSTKTCCHLIKELPHKNWSNIGKYE